MKCKCGFNAEGGERHLDAHIAFYANVPPHGPLRDRGASLQETQ